MTLTERPRRSALSIALRVAISITLITILVLPLDWDLVRQLTPRIPIWVAILGLALAFLAYGFSALKLRRLLGAQDLRIGLQLSFNLTLAGLFASNFLPSTVGGDALKLFALNRYGYRAPIVLSALVVDRATGLIASIVLLGVVVPFSGLLARPWSELSASLAATLLVSLFLLIRRDRRRKAAGGRLGCRLDEESQDQQNSESPSPERKSSLEKVRSILTDLIHRWNAKPVEVALAISIGFAISVVGHLNLWLISTGVGLSINFLSIMAIGSIVAVVTTIPVSINAIGLQEASYAYLLTEAGASLEQAVIVAGVVRLLNLAATLPGGVCVWLMRTTEEPFVLR